MTEPVDTDPRLELRAAKLRNSTRRHPSAPADDQPAEQAHQAADDQQPVDHPPLTTGVHHDVPDDRYHADPRLSSSEARNLLPPSCPAKYRWTKDHGQAPRRTFDIGHAAHQMVLGAGPGLEVVDADNWRTKAAQQQAAEARAAGLVPLLAHEHAQVTAMAAALRAHPIAGNYLRPGAGAAEVTLAWDCPATGVPCRARLDLLPPPAAAGRLVIPDYKTCAEASPQALSRAVASYGYHVQAAWYLDGCRALGLGDDSAAFVFIAQEKTPPYLVSIFQPDAIAMRVGAEQALQARHVWSWCTGQGRWPSYSDEVLQLALPRWAEIEAGLHA